jgi:H+/gluconate symporter-like permease
VWAVHLGGLALIICLGSILGKILEVSGAAEKISSTLINVLEKKIFSGPYC